ncbi:MAG: 3'-5' exonuclease [Chitinophagaceae bacterium]
MLASNPKYVDLHTAPKLCVYQTQRDEMSDIALSIQKLLQQGIVPGRIAVIYKENKYGEELAAFFRQLNVPYYSKRNLNVFEIPLVRRIILMLRYLAAEHDVPYGGDEMLFELLHHEWFSIAPIEIAKLSVATSEKRYSDRAYSLRRMLAAYTAAPPQDLFSNVLSAEMRRANTIIEALIAAVPNVTLQQLFETTIRSTGILGYIMRQPDKHWHLQVLTALFDFVKEETRRNPSLSLAQWIGIVDLMEKEEISLPLIQVNGSEKGVNLLTAHGAKGLEFEYVFLAGCNAAFWEKKRKPGGGYRLPDTLLPSSASGGVTESHEELRRLFFVAMTRAEQHLTLSYCRFKNDGKEMEPSMFVAEVQAAVNMPAEDRVLDAAEMAAFTALQFEVEQAPELAVLEEDFIAPIIEKFVMNVTALNNYFKCPLQFYFNNLIRIPSPKSESTEFGLAVHHALEHLFRNMKKDPAEQFPSIDVFIESFEWYMHRHRESFTAEQFQRRMEYGKEVLSNYYVYAIPQASKVVAIETSIKNVLVKGVPIKGKMDKLEFDGKQVNVVDYKTGDPDKAMEKLQSPSEKQPLGGDYWRQAVFYKILIDQYPQKDWQAVSTQFDFVEPDKKKKYRSEKLVITPADITTVTQQITSVWDRIQQRDFYTGCGKPDCHWCNFVKDNNMAVAIHDIEEAEEA